jgi:ferritin-like metal-binding protein YciE
MKTLHELFVDGIKDMYNAEKQLIKALPKMAKLAKDEQLKEGFQNHLRQTEEQAQRIEQVCQSLGEKPAGMACKAMKGLVDEANEHLQGMKASSCTDAELIALAQKVEHYEIGSYGTLIEWAKLMDHEDAVNLLQQNLDEEKETNEQLTQIAESSVNQMAAEESQQMGMGDRAMTGNTRGRGKATGTTRKPATQRGSGRAPAKRATGRGATSGRGKTNGRAKASGRGGTATRGKTKARGRASAR